MNTIPQNPIENSPEEPLIPEIQESTFPTLIDLAAIFGVFCVAQFGVALLAIFLIPLLMPNLSSADQTSYTMLFAQVVSMVAVIIFISIFRSKRGAEPIKLQFAFKGFDPSILLGGVIMLISTSVVIEPLLGLMPSPPEINGSGWPMLVALVVGAPLFEEIICRGMIFEALRTRRGIVAAWLISSLFFGLMHLHPTMIVNAFFMGLILCYFYIRSGSLIAPMILHAINNGIAYLLILVGIDQNLMLRDLITNQTLYWVVYGLAVIILVVATMLCKAQFKRLIAQDQSEEQEPAEQES